MRKQCRPNLLWKPVLWLKRKNYKCLLHIQMSRQSRGEGTLRGEWSPDQDSETQWSLHKYCICIVLYYRCICILAERRMISDYDLETQQWRLQQPSRPDVGKVGNVHFNFLQIAFLTSPPLPTRLNTAELEKGSRYDNLCCCWNLQVYPSHKNLAEIDFQISNSTEMILAIFAT